MEEEPGGNHNNLRARSIYNLCDLHSSQNSKGKAYGELVQTYQVMFCGYTIFPDRQDFINPFSIRHDIDNGLLHDAVKVLFVELSKLNEILKKPVDEMTDMERISVFLHYAENPDYRDVVNKVIESKEGLAVAGEVLMSISKDERERAIFRSRRMYQADQESNRVTAERRGARQRDFEIARNAMQMKLAIDDIIKLTGLTREEVENLSTAN